MNILLLGGSGQIGWELARTLLPLGTVTALDRADADLASQEQLLAVIRALRPQVIVNAAAYTAVDRAESESATAFAINAEAPGFLAAQAQRTGALFVHYSTDYVFDGAARRPYLEDDPCHPLNVYGQSKLAGERAVTAAGGDSLILRTSWVYGARGHNFLRTVLRLAAEREELRVVDDTSGTPTWSRWIAEASAHMVRMALERRAAGRFHSGLYHMACAGSTSWNGFAHAVVGQYRELYPEAALRVRAITPLASAEYPLPATRPLNSRLDCSKLAAEYGIAGVEWQQALRFCLQEFRATAGHPV